MSDNSQNEHLSPKNPERSDIEKDPDIIAKSFEEVPETRVSPKKKRSKRHKKKRKREDHTFDLSQIANLELAEKHGRSCRVYVQRPDIKDANGNIVESFDERCPCCSKFIDGQQFSLACSINDLVSLGSSFPLYFSLSKFLILALLLVLVIACGPCLINNGIQDRYDDWTEERSMNLITPSNFGNIWGPSETNPEKIPVWQNILHIISCGLLIFFQAWILKYLKESAIDFDCVETNPSDFTLMIKGLPKTYSKLELKKHIEENFLREHLVIINIVSAYDIHDYIKYCNDLRQLEFKRKFIEHYRNQYNTQPTVTVWCRKKDLETLEECDKQISYLEQQRDECFKVMNTDNQAPVAFVTFSKQIIAREIEAEWGRTNLQSLLGKLCMCCVNEKYKFQGNFIHAEMAPDQSDINWENLSVPNSKKFIFRAVTIIIATITIGVACIIMIATANWKSDVYENNKNESWIKIRAATVIPPIVTVMVNFLIARLVRIYSSYEKHSTWTEFNRSVLDKLVFFLLLNNLAIPIFIYADKEKRWFTQGGLTYTVFWLEIMNALVGPLIYLISPKNLIKKLQRSNLRSAEKNNSIKINQHDANLIFEGPEVDLADRFAMMIKTFALALFYSPIVPIGSVICIICLIIEAFLFKFMLLRVHCRPKVYNSALVIHAATWMKRCILIYSVGIFIFYSQLVPSLVLLDLFFFLAVAGYVLSPISSILLCCFKDTTIEKLEGIFSLNNKLDDFFKELPNFYSDYERENPVTKANGWKRWKNFLKEKIPESYIGAVGEDKFSSEVMRKRYLENLKDYSRMQEIVDKINKRDLENAEDYTDRADKDYEGDKGEYNASPSFNNQVTPNYRGNPLVYPQYNPPDPQNYPRNPQYPVVNNYPPVNAVDPYNSLYPSMGYPNNYPPNPPLSQTYSPNSAPQPYPPNNPPASFYPYIEPASSYQTHNPNYP